MKWIYGFLLFIISLFNSAKGSDSTKLILLIAIDGLRGDLLTKYEAAFTGGLNRLKNEGFNFANAWVDHAITVSHAGHVTLATGNYPKTHGIVDAAYYRKEKGKYIFTDAFQDSTFTITGFKAKSISPKNIITTGLAEWVKENDSQARSLSVGTGNISSALYNFRSDNEVYWLNAGAARYITSTYYKKEYPDWVKNFNIRELMPLIKKSTTWDLTVPEQYRKLANKDDEPFESEGRNNTFPHTMQKELGDFAKDTLRGPAMWFGYTPFMDVATLSFAQAGISALQLGQRNSKDFLAIVLSHVDNTSHYYGPSSLETFDALVKIDKALGEFFTYLDNKVGKGKYVVALSSDHGFPEVPEQTAREGKWSRRLTEADIEKVLTDLKRIISMAGPAENIQKKLYDNLKSLDFVADVYTDKQLANTKKSNDPFVELYKKSFRPDRIPRLPFFSLQNFQSVIAEHGLMVRLKDNAMINLDVAIHGSAYDHDRYVPLYFMGAGVKHGRSHKKVATIDVAPTLAKLANIRINKVDGKGILPQ